ncbi:MAG: universal stress protein [Dehalococcoidia bacterium]
MPYELFLIAWLGVNLVFGALAAYLANTWGRDPFGWLLAGAVLGPMALIVLVVEQRRDGRKARPSLATAGSRARTIGEPNILIAVDGSSFSEQAVQYVVEHFGASLGEASVVGVLPVESAQGATMEEGSPRKDLLEEEIQRHLGTASSTLQKAGIACRSLVRFGDPANEILQLAREMEYDLIVVGRRGRGRAAKLLLGSVSEKLTKAAPCPVTVVG